MKYFSYLLVFIFLGNLSAQPSRRPVEAGKIIVKLKPDAVPVFERRLQTLRKSSSDTSTLSIGLKSFDRINRKYRASNMQRVFPDAGKYETKHRKYGLHLWYEITIPEGENPETVAAGYGVDENVQISEPRYTIRSFSMPPASSLFTAETPDDPGFDKQWNYNNTGQTGGTPGVDIRLPEAWETAKSIGIKNNNVIVAVMDGGVYYDHEDLKANMWVNEAELNGNGNYDDDGNGYRDDIYGYNFVGRSSGAIAPEDHATHVAGTIAAVTNNGIGVSGISGTSGDGYGIKIMTVQILDGNKSASSIGPAFAYAADNGAVISQNSWGYDKAGVYNSSDIDAINYFINEAGRDENQDPRPGTPMVGGIVIFAAGNDEKDDKWYPAYFDNVLAVAAVNHYGKLAWYSNFGNWVDISAPGGDTDEKGKNMTGGIYSTSYTSVRKNYYEYMQGTSMACPHVSGVAAMILSVYGSKDFTPDMLRTLLLCTATPLDGFDPENASKMGAGLLNAAAALAPPENTLEAPTDLTAQTINAVSCRLSWMPHTEDVAYFIPAYATEMITETNFDQYAHAHITAENTAGGMQQRIITGLTPATTYYVGIRNTNMCQISGVSNIATFTTRSNVAPVANPMDDIIMRDVAPKTAFYIGNVFTDSDDDVMTYEVTVSPSYIASAWIEGDLLMIQPIVAGNTTLTLSADDANSGRASLNVALTISRNQAPEIAGLPADITLIPYATTVNIDLSEYIVDAEGDPVTYTVEPSQDGIVNASINNNILTIDPQHFGQVTLQLTASDPYSATNTISIEITVEQKYTSDKKDKLLIYPNPVTDILNYSFVLDESATVSIRIVNTLGRTVYQTPTENQVAGAHYYNLNISKWGIGMYFLQYIKNGKITDTEKFVKQ